MFPVRGVLTEQFSQEKVIKIAQIGAALYLVSKLSGIFNTKVLSGNGNEVFSRSQSREAKIIVIDTGHGGSDPEAIGGGGLKEKDLNLDVAQ